MAEVLTDRALPITVIILTCNRLYKLQAALASLLRQLAPGDEILVLDTGSSDGTREWLAGQSLPLRAHFLASTSVDFAAARNEALRMTATPLVAFLDDDCVPAPDWLERMRSVLSSAEAVGGIVAPFFLYEQRRWWSGELAWCAGMSPLGLLEQRDDNYPATANLGARRYVFEQVPFGELRDVPLAGHNKYFAGREDAEWWASIRRHGFKAVIDPQLVVYHAVPKERFSAKEVLRRAWSDGVAAWKRNPSPEGRAREQAQLIESIALKLARPICTVRGGLAELASSTVWSTRQIALLSAATNLPSKKVIRDLLPAVIRRSARLVAGTTRLRMVRRLRPAFKIPDPPQQILIAAPTYLGDTVLLLPIVDVLAQNWPEANIVVWTRFPELFSPTSPMITVVGSREDDIKMVEAYAKWGSEVTFVPYYHFGPRQLWRRVLSLRAVTFSHDVGFTSIADYFYAPHRIEKRFDQHESLNLLELISLWPLAGSLLPPRLAPSQKSLDRLFQTYPVLRDQPYVTLHVDTALEMKKWPLERWEVVARTLTQELRVTICLIGSEKADCDAQLLQQKIGSEHVVNCCGLALPELVALLSQARMAIGPCSGPKHLAYALRTPTFTLYGAVPETRWGAWFDRNLHDYICSPVEYLSPREQQGLPENHAMLLIPAELAVERILAHYKRLYP